jgi:hypothetical protein
MHTGHEDVHKADLALAWMSLWTQNADLHLLGSTMHRSYPVALLNIGPLWSDFSGTNTWNGRGTLVYSPQVMLPSGTIFSTATV